MIILNKIETEEHECKMIIEERSVICSDQHEV